MTTVGIVSPGAMGSTVGAALQSGGARVTTTLAGRSTRTARLARGLELLPSVEHVVETADIVLSVVPPGEARGVAAAIAAAARASGAHPLVVELNAVSPATVCEMEAALEKSGLELVDGSISGRPPGPDTDTVAYLSGGQAATIATLIAPGLTFRVVGDRVGLASAVKMSTASVYTGRLALLTQALRAARANGVLGPVLDDLRRSEPDLADRASAALQRAASVSGRYVAEMHEIASSQRAAGLTPALFEALARVYEALDATNLATLAPEDVDASLALEDVLERL